MALFITDRWSDLFQVLSAAAEERQAIVVIVVTFTKHGGSSCSKHLPTGKSNFPSVFSHGDETRARRRRSSQNKDFTWRRKQNVDTPAVPGGKKRDATLQAGHGKERSRRQGRQSEKPQTSYCNRPFEGSQEGE